MSCWMQTFTGVAFDLLAPTPDMVRLADIAESLAHMPRFNAHTNGVYKVNVAQHSLLVEELMPPDAEPAERLWALLHDAHEAYVGDLPTPVKQAMRAWLRMQPLTIYKYVDSRNVALEEVPDAFAAITDGIDVAVRTAFGLPSALPDAWRDQVAQADLIALRLERDHRMGKPPREWGETVESIVVPDVPTHLLVDMPPSDVRREFLRRFEMLQRMRHGLPDSDGVG